MSTVMKQQQDIYELLSMIAFDNILDRYFAKTKVTYNQYAQVVQVDQRNHTFDTVSIYETSIRDTVEYMGRSNERVHIVTDVLIFDVDIAYSKQYIIFKVHIE